MSGLGESLARLLGKEPKVVEPETFTPEVASLHEEWREKMKDPEVQLLIKNERLEKDRQSQPWRRRRWAVLIGVNLIFVLSYWLDVQLVEGALTASRVAGFHFADLNSSLHVMLASKLILMNLVIGTVTVGLLWWALGGRTFCSWVCPYHLLSEWVEILHLRLAKRRWVKDHPLDRRVRPVFWLLFILLSLITGYTVFETISPTGILSRALTYGPSLALAWVGALLLVELLYSRRAWCRYLCPIGLTYGFLGATSPLRVRYDLGNCLHETACRQVCLVPHVLDHVIKNRADSTTIDIGADCTRCGRCIDACGGGALSYAFGPEKKS